MASLRMAARRLAHKHDLEVPDDFLRALVELVVHQIMEVEVSQLIGADRYERSDARTTWRNGTRKRRWDTRMGTYELAIPKLREGTYFPSFLEPRRRSERAMMAVIQEAYIEGVSTRKVERLAEALGIEGISKSQVSRMCEEIDDFVEAWRSRRLEEPIRYLWLDATFPKVREDGRVQGMGVVIAVGVTQDGHRIVLGVDIGATENGDFWLAFLRSLVARGLHGVLLVISDAHGGIASAVAAVLTGASWQRCRVHFMRNVLAKLSKSQAEVVMALIRTIFAQPTDEGVHDQFQRVVDMLSTQHAEVAAMLEDAKSDLLAFTAFPQAHWRKIWSTNPLERLNREIKRRADVAGIFPNRAAVIRLVGALLMEQDDEWIAGRRYLSQQSMAPLEAMAAKEADLPATLETAYALT